MLTKLITGVTTEPISLADVLAQIRQNTSDLAGNITMSQSLAPGSHAIGIHTGVPADTFGYSCLVMLEAGECGGAADAIIQESDDDLIFNNWASGTFTQVTSANDNATYEKEYTGNKRYIRTIVTVAGDACEFGTSLLLYAITSGESGLINFKIQAAREYGEDFTNHSFAPQTWACYLNDFPGKDSIEWPKGPLTSITSVKYTDKDGVTVTMVVTTDYVVDTDTFPGKVYLPYNKSWPSFTPKPYNALEITGVCGYTGTDPYKIPHNFKEAMLVHVGLMFRYRDEEIPENALKVVHRLYNLRSTRRL